MGMEIKRSVKIIDHDAINNILSDINNNYDITDADDITQLIIDILYTFDREEFESALLQIRVLENGD